LRSLGVIEERLSNDLDELSLLAFLTFLLFRNFIQDDKAQSFLALSESCEPILRDVFFRCTHANPLLLLPCFGSTVYAKKPVGSLRQSSPLGSTEQRKSVRSTGSGDRIASVSDLGSNSWEELFGAPSVIDCRVMISGLLCNQTLVQVQILRVTSKNVFCDKYGLAD
jgi:hypothetical protein